MTECKQSGYSWAGDYDLDAHFQEARKLVHYTVSVAGEVQILSPQATNTLLAELVRACSEEFEDYANPAKSDDAALLIKEIEIDFRATNCVECQSVASNGNVIKFFCEHAEQSSRNEADNTLTWLEVQV